MKKIRLVYQACFSVLLGWAPVCSLWGCSSTSTTTVTLPDISTGVNVNGLNISAISYQTYSSLNQNQTILSAVVSAINTAKGTTVTTSDFTLTNNQLSSALQIANTAVTFTVTGTGAKITGSFEFSLILVKPNISTGIKIADPNTPADPTKTYTALNSNSTITGIVAAAINAAEYVNVVPNTDFILTNDGNGNQVPGTVVTFTVIAIGNQIQGTFTFTDTLGKIDISSGVTVNNLRTGIIPNATYGDLNQNKTILNAIVNAIYQAKGISVVAGTDFILTNNQYQFDTQTADTLVTFTVTATGSQIQGSFTFVDTLTRINISSGIIIPDLQTPADPSNIFNNLNNNQQILNAIINAIYQAKGITVTPNVDFILTNNQVATNKQVVGAAVKFTVSATGNQIVGSFSFVDTLGLVNISNGVSVPDLKSATSTTDDYSLLNTNSVITNAVVNAIYQAKAVSVALGTDFTLTNNQTGLQTPNTVVIFTVSATSTSALITGSFNFIDTLSKVSIASGVSVPDLKTRVDISATYGDLNNNPDIINAVVNAILAAKNVNVQLGIDFTLRNNRVATTNQVAGTIVTFTVTALTTSNLISGVFTFVDTLTSSS